MAEEPQQITKEPQQVTTKEPQQVTKEPQRVTTKNPKKVEAGKRLAESNRKKREVKKIEQAKLEASGVNQYYGIGAVMGPRPLCSLLALGVIGGLGYYIYRTKKGEQPKQNNPKQHRQRQAQTQPQTNKFEMDKKSIVNDLYQAAVISVLAVGYSMLGKKILKITPPSVQTFDLEDTGKLVAIVAASEMTREYLIKQKILPDHINV